MLTLHLKNFIRVLVGFLSVLMPVPARDIRVYCNLTEAKVYGGPNRFLKNITGSRTLLIQKKSKATGQHL
jgi:hypothetical protein